MKIRTILIGLAGLAIAVSLYSNHSHSAEYLKIFDASAGKVVEASAVDKVSCIDCGGSGKCSICEGEGKIVLMRFSQRCPICRGSGLCTTCYGHGELSEYKAILEKNKDDTPKGFVSSGKPDDLYACRYCFGTGDCKSCNGSGTNSTLGIDCSSCKHDKGKCSNCMGKGYLTREEHNERVFKNTTHFYPDTDDENYECPSCKGSGKCIECNGTGKNDASSPVFRAFGCRLCDKTGKCPGCGGDGTIAF